MLDDSHFSTELRAIPVLIAKLIISVVQLTLVADANRRYALLELEVMRRGKKGCKQQGRNEHVTFFHAFSLKVEWCRPHPTA
ncbi:hypothetical protein D3C80_1881630 [compost metagenome]